MPFAQFGAPHRNAELARAAYPADFIAEAIDQTRGWFYTLMAIGTLVFDQSSYRNVLCLGHILAEDGRKMSKHLGNILEPIPLMDRHGADAVRWFMLAGGSPWSARRVGHKVLDEIASKVLRTYWSIASFQSLYARANDWTPGRARRSPSIGVLDRWARSEAHALIDEVSAALDVFDTARAGKALAGYIDDLSNWYVRRSRRRFWDGDPAALATLHECLDIVTRLLAPFVPFVTERVWSALFAADRRRPESVHLARWPVADAALVDTELGEQVALVRRLVELGRAARAESGMKTRQPLARALVAAPGWAGLPDGPARSGARRTQRRRPRQPGRHRRADRAIGQAELPHPGPALRRLDPVGRRGDRRRRSGRAGHRPARRCRHAHGRRRDRRTRAPKTSSSARRPLGLGRRHAAARTRSRWTSS